MFKYNLGDTVKFGYIARDGKPFAGQGYIQSRKIGATGNKYSVAGHFREIGIPGMQEAVVSEDDITEIVED